MTTNKPPMETRKFRIDPRTWEQAIVIARSRGDNLSDIPRDAITKYVKKHGPVDLPICPPNGV